MLTFSSVYTNVCMLVCTLFIYLLLISQIIKSCGVNDINIRSLAHRFNLWTKKSGKDVEMFLRFANCLHSNKYKRKQVSYKISCLTVQPFIYVYKYVFCFYILINAISFINSNIFTF